MKLRERFGLIRKALSINLPTTGGTTLWTTMPRTTYNYEQQVGTGRQSAIIMACIRWLQRTFPEAPLMLESPSTEGEWEQEQDHPFLALLDVPNPYYD